MSKYYKRARKISSVFQKNCIVLSGRIFFERPVEMASRFDWDEILRDRYATFKLEEEGFIESLKVCNSTEVSAQKIYYTIRDAPDIPTNLIMMYREAVFGFNEKVKN